MPVLLTFSRRQSPNPRPTMFFCPVNKPAPALLAKRMNEPPSNGPGEHLVAGIEALSAMTLKASWRVFNGPLASASLHKLIAAMISARFERSVVTVRISAMGQRLAPGGQTSCGSCAIIPGNRHTRAPKCFLMTVRNCSQAVRGSYPQSHAAK